jgi:hypothetical protein
VAELFEHASRRMVDKEAEVVRMAARHAPKHQRWESLGTSKVRLRRALASYCSSS